MLKFGGSCLQDANSFKQTTNIIRKYAKDTKLIIVTSALKGITDKLIDFYKNSCEETPECDLIIENIYYIHKNLVDEIIDDKAPEYRNTLDFIDENIEELSQLGRIVRLLRPSMDIQDIIVINYKFNRIKPKYLGIMKKSINFDSFFSFKKY